jgi:hypothetical protein
MNAIAVSLVQNVPVNSRRQTIGILKNNSYTKFERPFSYFPYTAKLDINDDVSP